MEIALNRHIKITPDVSGGKPRLAGTRIAVADVVIMYRHMGESLEEIASKYNLSLATVYAAIAYYYDHQVEMDRFIREDEAIADAFMQAHSSLLQEKLKASRGEQSHSLPR